MNGLSGFVPRLDPSGFAGPMAVLVAGVAAAVLAYTLRAPEEGRRRLLAWLVAFTAAMELLVVAGDLLTLLIAWELVGVCSWALIGHRYRQRESPRAAAQAFLTTRFGDLGLYLAAAAAFAGAGSFDYRALSELEAPYLHVVAGGLLLAAAAKSAQVPFAPWLFSAMAGPTPASALLHSATMVAAGAFVLVRLAPELAAATWLGPATAAVGIATVWAGGLVAAVQNDLKRALAASTSSQYGLMFVAVGAGSTAAAGAHLAGHAAFKALLFLGAGVAVHAAGTGELSVLARRGLLRRLPRTAGLFAVGVLALAAVPPLGAAWSKEEVVAAAMHHASWLGWAVLLSGVLTAFYAGRLQLLAFAPVGAAAADLRRPTRGELGGIAALAAASVGLGVLWLPPAERWVEAATGGTLAPGTPWELAAGVAGVALAAGAVWLARRWGLLLSLGLPERVRAGVAGWLGLPALARYLVARPVLATASALAAFDRRVVDAGVRGAAWVGEAVSGLLARWSERGVDGAVRGLAAAGLGVSRGAARFDQGGVDRVVERLAAAGLTLARGSGRLDDRRVDGAVEGLARATGRAGAASRRAQTGKAHHYYTLIAAGTVAVLAVAILGALLGR